MNKIDLKIKNKKYTATEQSPVLMLPASNAYPLLITIGVLESIQRPFGLLMDEQAVEVNMQDAETLADGTTSEFSKPEEEFIPADAPEEPPLSLEEIRAHNAEVMKALKSMGKYEINIQTGTEDTGIFKTVVSCKDNVFTQKILMVDEAGKDVEVLTHVNGKIVLSDGLGFEYTIEEKYLDLDYVESIPGLAATIGEGQLFIASVMSDVFSEGGICNPMIPIMASMQIGKSPELAAYWEKIGGKYWQVATPVFSTAITFDSDSSSRAPFTGMKRRWAEEKLTKKAKARGTFAVCTVID